MASLGAGDYLGGYAGNEVDGHQIGAGHMDRDIWLLLVRILIVVSALLAVSGIVGCAIGHFIARGTHGPKPVPPAAPGLAPDRQRVAPLAGRARRATRPISRATPGAVSPFQRDHITTKERMRQHPQRLA
jgi:hypothetical protein